MKAKNKRLPNDSSINFHAIAYRYLKDAPAKKFRFSKKIRDNLIRSHIKINHVVYISSMFFWSIIVAISTFPISLILFEFLAPILGISSPTIFSVIYSLLVSTLVGGVTFLTFFYYPIHIASSIKGQIEKNMVYTANYMTILSNAGATTEETFASLVRVGKFFGVKESAKAIMKSIEFLGDDTIMAINEESKRTPSKDYGAFLQGYIASMQTGGNRESYLAAMAEKFMDSRKRTLSRLIEQLDMAGELFVAGLVAFPIIMITLLSVMGFFGGDVMGGLSAPQLMSLMTYIVIPFVAIGLLIFIDALMSSW